MSSRCKPFESKHGESGFSLLEMIAAVAIMAMIVVGVFALINQSSDDTRASVTALHLKTIGDAAKVHIRDNFVAISGVATAVTPFLITIADLQGPVGPAGELPDSFSALSPRRQNTCVLVLQPAVGQLEALVVTEGGDIIDDLTLGQIAAQIGGEGGSVYLDPGPPVTTRVRGAMGGWDFPVGNFGNVNNAGQRCDGTAGNVAFAAGHPVIALWFSEGTIRSSTLYRDAVPGNPQLNTMDTPIFMGAPTIMVEETACATNGAISRNGTGRLMSCDNLVWKRTGSMFWEDPVANFAALPATDPAGTVRIARDTARAFMWNGAAWSALAVDQNGNLNVPGTITVGGNANIAGSAGIGGNANIAGSAGINGSIGVGGNANIAGSAGINGSIGVGGNANIAGSAGITGSLGVGGNTSTNTMTFTSVYTLGAGCAPNGLVSRNAAGQLMSCQGGIWKGALAGPFTTAFGASGGGTAVATCPAGSTLVIGSCRASDNCSGNDWSGHGGYPSGNSWVCPGWWCNTTWAYASCHY